MIDTIVLTIPQKNFTILDHKKFIPSSRPMFEPPYYEFGKQPYFKCVYNPAQTDLINYKYLPRLTLIKALRKGGFEIFLRVEFSIPKLLYGNNFDEVEESDFGEICWKIKNALDEMKVRIDNINAISNAEVSVVHYSKNIILTDYTTPYAILREMAKVDVTRLLDTNQSDFRNEGHAVKFHSNDFEVIMYDKLKDLQQAKLSEKRSIEKDNNVQLSLFDTVPVKRPFEVLRMEVRLGSRNRIKEFLKQLKYKDFGLSFVNLFNKQIAQYVLIKNLQNIEEGYPKILTPNVGSNEELFTQMMINNPDLTLRNILMFIGARILLQETGTRKLKKLAERFGTTNWYRLQRDMKSLVLSNDKNPFSLMSDALYKFEKVELKEFEIS